VLLGHGRLRRDQRLGDDLPAEDAADAIAATRAGEAIRAERAQLEQAQKVGDDARRRPAG
jgi:hypothetical protein